MWEHINSKPEIPKEKQKYPLNHKSKTFHVVCTCLGNANVEDGGLVFLWEVLRSSFEAYSAVILFDHFEDSDGISIGQPGDKCPAVKR